MFWIYTQVPHFCIVDASEALKILITRQSSHNADNKNNCYFLYYSALQHIEHHGRKQHEYCQHSNRLPHNSPTTNTVSHK